MAELDGGTVKGWAQGIFGDSMADEIERAFDEARGEVGLPPLPVPIDEQDRNNRRILFVAIARGVIRHLQKQQDAFDITWNIGNFIFTTHPTIHVKP